MIALIIQNWRLVAETVAIVVFVLVVAFLRVDVANLKASLATSESKVVVLQSANDTYKSLTEKQNAAVTDMQTQATEREKVAREAVASAHETAGALAQKALDIRAALPGDDLCKSARNLIEKTLVTK